MKSVTLVQVEFTPRVGPSWAGVSRGKTLFSCASLSGAFVATSSLAILAVVRCAAVLYLKTSKKLS